MPVLGMNAIDHGDSASVAIMCAGTTIPLLQDTPSARVWERAGAQKDDVFILDAQRHVIRVFSVVTHPLTTSTNRDSLRAWVRDVVAVP